MSYVCFAGYQAHVDKTISPDTREPSEIIQLLVIKIGMKLSCEGRFPVSCGTGKDLDMDIVNQGILSGLESLEKYNPKKGTLRQFLWKSIAGAMYDYAWQRESSTGFLDRKRLPFEASLSQALEGEVDETPDEDAEERSVTIGLAELFYPSIEDQLISEEAEKRRKSYVEIRKEAFQQLSKKDQQLMLKAGRIGADRAKRDALASELGISYESLAVRVTRIRRKLKALIEGKPNI